VTEMGSSKKHKDKDRAHRHKHRKHRSHDRSRSRSRGHRHGDDERRKEKGDDRKHRDNGEEMYTNEEYLIQPPVADNYDGSSAAVAPPSPVYAKQELADEGW